MMGAADGLAGPRGGEEQRLKSVSALGEAKLARADSCPQSGKGAFVIHTASGSDDGIVEPHISQVAALPSLADFKSSGAPLILTGDPRCKSQVIAGSMDPSTPVAMNRRVSVETELFSGALLPQVRGYPGTPQSAFGGTKWLGRTVIQGRFKRPIPASDIWVGQELWNRPLLPPGFLKLVFQASAKFFSSTCRIISEDDSCGFLNPMLAMSNVVNVARPGEEPDIMGCIPEDVRLMNSSMVDRKGAPMASAARQRFYDRPANLSTAVFDDQHVYTFVICQNIMDLLQYKLSVGGYININLDLCQLLNGQPLQMMCKNVKNNKTIVSLLMWHERLNYPEGCAARLAASRVSVASSSEAGSSIASGLDSYGSGSVYTYGASSSGGGSGSSSSLSSMDSSFGTSDGCGSSSSDGGSSSSDGDADACTSGAGSRRASMANDSISEYGSAFSEIADSACGEEACAAAAAALDAIAEAGAGDTLGDATSAEVPALLPTAPRLSRAAERRRRMVARFKALWKRA